MKPSTVFFGAFSIASFLAKIKRLPESPTPAELIDLAMGCPAIRPQQSVAEFLELAQLVKDLQCKYLLEIGTYRGGTLFVFSRLAAADAVMVSVDLSMTFLGNCYRAGQAPFLHRFIRKGQSLLLLRKDSHRPATLARIQQALQGEKLDFLFIDGDHSYGGVRKDFEMYSVLVRAGGMIAFHDITPCGPPKEVCKLWNEIKGRYTHKEFIDQTGKEAMGIGVLWI